MAHVIKYHVAIPVGIFAVLLVVGVPLGTALVVGVISGCASMMFMGMNRSSGHQHHDHDQRDPESDIEPR